MTDPLPLEETLAILGELIGFPTVSSDGNLALIAYATARLDGLGVDTRLTVDGSGAKANLFATIGPRDTDGGIVLSGHTDVVPVAGQDWSSDPFAADLREGRVYGRGACDMKGFLAAMLAMAPRFAAMELRRPLHLAFTFDEEVGCLGAQAMLADLAASGPRPALCIVGEPTDMRIVAGHKGCCEYTTRFTGLEGHCSAPDLGVNAVEYAVRYVGRLLEAAEALKDRAPADSPFDPPWSTLQVGRMSGGIARNVIAGACEVEWELRPVAPADHEFVHEAIGRHVAEVLLPAMRRACPDADIVTEVIGEVAGLVPVPQSEAVALVRALTGDNGPAGVVSFGTEAGLYQQLGVSTVICGPGSIAQAHKPDEYVAVEQLSACLRMIAGLEARLV